MGGRYKYSVPNKVSILSVFDTKDGATYMQDSTSNNQASIKSLVVSLQCLDFS